MTSLIIPNDFNRLADFVVGQVADSSRRMYQRTYGDWAGFAFAEGFDPLDITYERVEAFVHMPGKSRSTMQSRLSHMRKLLNLMSIVDDRYERHYKVVKDFLKIRVVGNPEPLRRALTIDEVHRLFRSFEGDSDYAVRNQALIRMAVYTGARRSELARMRWDDLDVDRSTISIPNGKGGKPRIVAILDKTQGTAIALSWLRDRQCLSIGACELMFTKVAKFRHAFTSCEPIAPATVYHLVTSHAASSGIGRLTPHDLRRTHITLMMDSGGESALANAQAQAGHKHPQTTMLYAQPSQAQARHIHSF